MEGGVCKYEQIQLEIFLQLGRVQVGFPFLKTRGMQLPQCLISSFRFQISSCCKIGILNLISIFIQQTNQMLTVLTQYYQNSSFKSLHLIQQKGYSEVQSLSISCNYNFFYNLQKIQMLQWFKKSFDQFQDSNWYYESMGDQKIYDSTVEHIHQQMKQQKREFLNKTIQKLGFKEQRDYDGKVVLKNNVPIKKSMTYREVQGLIGRLRGGDLPSAKPNISRQQYDRQFKKQIQEYDSLQV